MSVYERVEAMVRERLAGRRGDFRERCVRLALWLIRKHGPYGHVFSLPRDGKSKAPGFHRRIELTPEGSVKKVYMTQAQLRGATKALVEIEFLSRISPQRETRRLCDPPVQFAVGPDFALLFTGSHKKNRTLEIKAPLFVATYKNPIPRPMRFDPPRPKDERDLALARLAELKAQPLPQLSAGVLDQLKRPGNNRLSY